MVKFLIYLNRCVFVMVVLCLQVYRCNYAVAKERCIMIRFHRNCKFSVCSFFFITYIYNFKGQFGKPLFSFSAFVGFLIATITSILDSIGDYYACANSCRVPPPPGHATNRGIAVEGFCSMLSGIWGAGHATSTYGGNIGAIGMTKVIYFDPQIKC